jgi:lipopolysaccharide transport system permease protein
MKINWSEIKRWQEFLIIMTNKEIKAKYKMTFLGILWMAVNPFLQMLIIGVVFQFFVPMKIDNYFIFLLSGILPWNFVSSTILRSTKIIINERSLVQKSNFPKEILVLSVVVANLLHFLVSLAILSLVVLFISGLTWNYFYLPATIFLLTIMVSGVSLLLASLNVRFRDIDFIVQAIVPLWFYVSPIAYTLDLLPKNYTTWFVLNPLTGILNFMRFSLLGIQTNYMNISLISLGWCFLTLFIGILVFAKASQSFDEWV